MAGLILKNMSASHGGSGTTGAHITVTGSFVVTGAFNDAGTTHNGLIISASHADPAAQAKAGTFYVKDTGSGVLPYFIGAGGSATDLTSGTGRSVSGDTDNAIMTWVTSNDTFAAEANLLFTGGALTVKGSTPTITIGDAGAEDTKLVFDGNAQDFYVGLKDSDDKLHIGLGSTVGTTPNMSLYSAARTVEFLGGVVIPDAGSIGSATDTNAITISSGGVVAVTATTAASSTTTGALTVAGGASVAADLYVGDDLNVESNSAAVSVGSDEPFTLTHSNANNTLMATADHRLAFGDAGEYIAGDGTDLKIVSSNDIDVTGDLNVTGEVTSTKLTTLASAEGITTIGSTTAATFSAAGLLNVNNATEATTTGDGSLQTDGGLSVVKSAVIGDDLDLLSDGAILNIGSTSKFTLTDQSANNCVMAASGARLAFGNAGEYISGDGTDLDIISSGDLDITATLVDVTGALTVSGAVTLGDATGDDVTITGRIAADIDPKTDNTYDLGAANLRWRNIYTGDLHLANDRGSWTVVEEAEMLTLRNNKTGKWYQMNMTEIDPTGRDEGMADTL